ncbi:hypothetical protein K3495_g1522 [Podosphaera aphanis]|nr:hypothetical protein K3495_g1522 [Podosphaera aphanis]
MYANSFSYLPSGIHVRAVAARILYINGDTGFLEKEG